jgi:hypothetical protein
MPPDAGHPELPHSDAAGWALGALDPADAEAFQIHLRDCAECQATMTGFEAVTRALKCPAPAVEPPPDLAAKTLASIQHAILTAGQPGAFQPVVMMAGPAPQPATAATVQQAVQEAKKPGNAPGSASARMSRWWHWHWNFPVFSLAAALGAAVAAVIVVVAQIGQGAAPAVAGAGTQIPLHATAVRTSAGVQPSGHATARHTAGGWQVHLTVKNLPRLGAGEFYECWYAGPGNRPGHPRLITAGTFRARTGSFTMWSAADPLRFTHMQITAESPDDPGRPGLIVLEGTARRV